MRKYLLTIGFLLLVLTVSNPAYATDDGEVSASPSPNYPRNFKTNIGDKVLKKLDKKSVEVREKATTRSASFWEKKKGIVRDRLTKVLDHLDKMAQRLDAIAEKIHVRITRLEEKGVDVTKLQVALDGCVATKSTFVAAVSDAKSKVASITDNGEADGSARAALASVKSAFESGKAHHKCLVGVIVILRATKPEKAIEDEK